MGRLTGESQRVASLNRGKLMGAARKTKEAVEDALKS